MEYTEKLLTITANKQIISYIDEGVDHASTIILIHGFPLNKTMWNKQIEVLQKDYRVVAYDIRGYGNSEIGDDDFTIESFVHDLLSLMDNLQIQTSVLCGFSMGGYIALNAIVNFPERFTSLILCDTNCEADNAEAKVKRMKSIESIMADGLEQYAEGSLKKLFAPHSLSKHISSVEVVREMIMKSPEQSIFKTLTALSEREETCTKLHAIQVPVLIMVGIEDEITPPEVAMAMHKKIKGSTLRIIDHAGHMSNMEQPDQFNEQLIMYLTKKQ